MERKTLQVIFGVYSNDGVGFRDAIAFEDTTPEFKNIVLSPHTEKYTYQILVKKKVTTLSQSELISVIEEATVEAENFLYVFSAAANQKYSRFDCHGYYDESGFHDIDSVYGNSVKLKGGDVRLTPSVTAGSHTVNEIKKKMLRYRDLARLRLFYDAANITEPIGRFISLYTLMLHFCSDGKRDSQEKVDTAILTVDSTVAQFRSPINSRKYETIFTKLRNDLSHKREDASLIETHNEIRKNVDRFEKIVKTYVVDGS